MPNIPARKPIAILAYKYSQGVDWARKELNIREVNSVHRRIVDKTGQVYYVITEADQLLGLEIYDYIIAPGFGLHEDCSYITQRAEERIR